MISVGVYALGENLETLVSRIHVAIDAERHRSVAASATNNVK